MRNLLIAILVPVASALPAPATTVDDVSPAAWDTRLDLETVGRLLDVYEQEHPDAIRVDGWTDLETFVESMPEPFARRIPLRDGWGRAYRIGRIGHAWAVVSAGENGVFETADRLGRSSSGDVDRPADSFEDFGDDLVRMRGEDVVNGPRTRFARQSRTLADMRSIGTAVESFAIDHNVYPRQDDGLRRIDAIRPDVEGVYIRRLPRVDGWGTPFLYWSNGLGYVLVSAGADRAFDRAWDTTDRPTDLPFVGATGRADEDVVFVDGRFVQWPEGAR